MRTAIRLKKLSLANESLLIKPKDMFRFEDHELIILETGRMGEPINGLRKMSSWAPPLCGNQGWRFSVHRYNAINC